MTLRSVMKGPVPAHPFLYATVTVLALYASNAGEYPIGVTITPLALVAAGAAACLGIAALLLRNVQKAALLATLVLVFCLSFAHIRVVFFFIGLQFGMRSPPPLSWMLAGGLLTVGAAAYLLANARSDFALLTRALNMTGVVLVALQIFPIVGHQIETPGVKNASPSAPLQVPRTSDATADNPHVFYIVLDAYGREDMLRKIYGYDNSPLVQALEQRGFFVARSARTNYSHTAFSLASTLNMEYLSDMAARFPQGSQDLKPVSQILRESKVREGFKKAGYQFASLWVGSDSTDIPDADIYVDELRQGEFSRGFWGLTIFGPYAASNDLDRKRILRAFQALPELAASSKPLFVFAHILAPHPPFVFDRNGAPVSGSETVGIASANHLTNEDALPRAEYMRRYTDQLIFTNKKLLEAIDGILSAATVDPIIIIQGDHGPGAFLCHERMSDTYLEDRMSILSAYHSPTIRPDLYDEITPVNTFRIVLNHRFGLALPLLEDRSFFSEVQRPYSFFDVTDQIGSADDQRRYDFLRTHENAGPLSRSAGDEVACQPPGRNVGLRR